MKKAYIVFDVAKREMRGHTDLTSLSDDVEMGYHSLRKKLRDGVIYTGDYFIGVVGIENSKRGGKGFK